MRKIKYTKNRNIPYGMILNIVHCGFYFLNLKMKVPSLKQNAIKRYIATAD